MLLQLHGRAVSAARHVVAAVTGAAPAQLRAMASAAYLPFEAQIAKCAPRPQTPPPPPLTSGQQLPSLHQTPPAKPPGVMPLEARPTTRSKGGGAELC